MSAKQKHYVALHDDIQIATSTQKLPADTGQTGTWQAGGLQVVQGSTITVKGKNLALSAVMTWIYQGGTAGTAPLPPVTDTANLSPGPSLLKDGGQDLLLDGDEATGMVDANNKIFVSSSQTLLSTD
ncbi:MAG: hypothetical protein AAFZ92_11905 [Pseudomonadota bacterium]